MDRNLETGKTKTLKVLSFPLRAGYRTAAAIGLCIMIPWTTGCRQKTEPGFHGTADAASEQTTGETQPDSAGAVEPDAEFAWQHHHLEELGVGFDLMSDVEVLSGTYESVHHVAQNTEPVQILVLHGGHISLKNWREGYGNWQISDASAVEKLEVCGVSAERQTLFQEGVWGEGGFVGPDGEIEFRSIRNPDRIHIAGAFEWRKTPSLAIWMVLADKREANRRKEEHFFASIRCTPEPPIDGP
jgi:hypothetical protein